MSSANAPAAAKLLDRTNTFGYENVPLTAAGFWVKVVKLVAASYLTALEVEFSSSKMQRIHLAWLGQNLNHFLQQTYSVSSFDFSLLSDKLDHSHLHELVHAGDLIQITEKVSNGSGLRDAT